MKKNVVVVLVTGLVLLLAASCASAPKKPAEPLDDLSVARKAAEDSRAKALEIKANVAVAALFSEADTVFTAAKESDTAEATEAALAEYKQATGLFTNAYDEAKAKRDAAKNALDTAERERKTSEDVLRQIEEEQNTDEEAGNE